MSIHRHVLLQGICGVGTHSYIGINTTTTMEEVIKMRH